MAESSNQFVATLTAPDHETDVDNATLRNQTVAKVISKPSFTRSCEGKGFGRGGRGGRQKGFVVSRNGAKFKLSPGFHSAILLFFDRFVTSLAR